MDDTGIPTLQNRRGLDKSSWIVEKYGSTMKEAAYNYLRDGGVTDEEIECFRSIMLEDWLSFSKKSKKPLDKWKFMHYNISYKSIEDIK